jgi:two-component system, response regulator, stage 0 sporulation protein A
MSIQARSKEAVAMSKSIKHVMVVDDSHFGLKKMVEMFDHVTDFKVVAKAKDGYEALSIMKRQHIDVILLDLFMPKCDGLAFLKQAHFDKLLEQTKVIVLSEIQDDNVIEQALQWGANFVLFKPFTSQTLVERLRILTAEKENDVQEQSSINSLIIKHLMDSGLPSHTFGYQYFRLAIEHVLKESKGVFSITKTIYPYVAEVCKTSSGNVDKAMRHSISLAYEHNRDRLKQFLVTMNYKDSNLKPSNSEYMGMILEKIKQDMYRSHS